jgi:hypothetical protein
MKSHNSEPQTQDRLRCFAASTRQEARRAEARRAEAEERVAAALRENLLKRKAQARQRDTNEPKTTKEQQCL